MLKPEDVSKGDILEYDPTAEINQTLSADLKQNLINLGEIEFVGFRGNGFIYGEERPIIEYIILKEGCISWGWCLDRFRLVSKYQSKIAEKFNI